MLKDKLSHFYGDWNLVPDDGLAAVFARFVAAGQPRMVVHSGWCDRILEDADFAKVLKRAFDASGAIRSCDRYSLTPRPVILRTRRDAKAGEESKWAAGEMINSATGENAVGTPRASCRSAGG